MGERPQHPLLLHSVIPTPHFCACDLSSLVAGSGSCRFSYADPSITVSYSLTTTTNTSDDWVILEKIRSASSLMNPTVFPSVTDPRSLFSLPTASPPLTSSYTVVHSDAIWHVFSPFPPSRAPTNSSTVIHLLSLPHHSKADGVRFRWTQEAPQGPEGYESCWGLDNVLLVNVAHRPPLLEDSLDPPNTANWLFFPGATVKVHSLIGRHYRSPPTRVLIP